MERGAGDPDLPELDEAVRQIALGENVTVFHGHQAAGLISGITESTSHEPIALAGDVEHSPDGVAQRRRRPASGRHRRALRVGDLPGLYTRIVETTEHGGHLLFDHLRQILGGPLVWAPGIDGGVVLSLRGGDFQFECGQDLSIGYLDHDADVVRLYIEESFSFRVFEADAAVTLRTEA